MAAAAMPSPKTSGQSWPPSADDDKEIESRFYGPLEFGTAGLRGTMKMGLHQMNIHVIRWATQGFANVICAEGSAAMDKGVAICMDCRHH